MNWFYVLWGFWVACGISLELFAVFSHAAGGTLSEVTWKWVTGRIFKDHSIPMWLAWVNRVVLAAFFVWLAPHLIFGIWS